MSASAIDDDIETKDLVDNRSSSGLSKSQIRNDNKEDEGIKDTVRNGRSSKRKESTNPRFRVSASR